jgi:hypothetical protein
MENEVRVTVRLPGELHAQIVALAADEDRSLNSQIVNLLRRALAEKSAAKGRG